MPSTEVQLLGGSFQDAEGNFLANGKLTFVLSQDIQVNGNTQICGGLEISVPLDANGNVIGSPPYYVWPNDTGDPINTFYTITGYSSIGQLSWGPNAQQILEGSPPIGTFDLGSLIPNELSYWVPPPQPVLFETNFVPNQSQVLVNFVAEDNMTITNDGGNVRFSAGSVPSTENAYDVIFSLPGSTPGPETLGIMVFTREVTFPQGLSNSAGHAETPPLAPSTWTLLHNDVSFGSFIIQTDGSFNFTSPSAQVFVPKDWLSVELPSADGVLSDVLFTLAGTR